MILYNFSKQPVVFEGKIVKANERRWSGNVPNVDYFYGATRPDLRKAFLDKGVKEWKADNKAPMEEAPKEVPVEEPPRENKYEIPEDWESLPFMSKRALARKINPKATNGVEVEETIRSVL